MATLSGNQLHCEVKILSYGDSPEQDVYLSTFVDVCSLVNYQPGNFSIAFLTGSFEWGDPLQEKESNWNN